MNRLCLLVLLLFLSGTFVSCKKAIRGLRTARTVSKISNKSSSYSSSSKAPTKSDSELKTDARAANKRLEQYRLQCSKYKKIFDTVYTAEQYNKTLTEFRVQKNNFYSWLGSQNFQYHNGNSSFAPKYNSWLEKFNNYHKTYTDTVRKSQQHSYTQITTQMQKRRVTRTR